MTITSSPTAAAPTVLGTPRLLAGVPELGRLGRADHLRVHGRPVARSRSWLVAALRDVNLLGRGGAGFPVATKLAATPAGSHVAVLVNGSEGEPASRKDRVLMTSAPHLVIDGALVVAAALGTGHVTISIHDRTAHDAVTRARDERDDAAGVQVTRTDDGFVGGEIRAVINGLGGARAVPGGRRVLPHVEGLHGRPTFASNVETFAHVALLARLGVAGYARTGSGPEPGTSLVTVIGDAAHAGVMEVPNGTPLSVLLPGAPAPTLIGGYHGTWVPSVDGLVLDRTALRAAGSPLGAGVLARPFPDRCVVDDVVRVARWLAAESAGQCGPCFFGLPAIADDLAALAAGAGPERSVSALRRLELVTGRGACAHPDGSALFIGSALRVLTPELELHRRTGSCGHAPAGVLPVPSTRKDVA